RCGPDDSHLEGVLGRRHRVRPRPLRGPRTCRILPDVAIHSPASSALALPSDELGVPPGPSAQASCGSLGRAPGSGDAGARGTWAWQPPGLRQHAGLRRLGGPEALCHQRPSAARRGRARLPQPPLRAGLPPDLRQPHDSGSSLARSALCEDGSPRPAAREAGRHGMAQPRAASQPHGPAVRGRRHDSQLSFASSEHPGGVRDLAPLRDLRPPRRDSRAAASGRGAAVGSCLGSPSLRIGDAARTGGRRRLQDRRVRRLGAAGSRQA
ncbi:unnamed protein product, partial [Prorocentrum cordatum]